MDGQRTPRSPSSPSARLSRTVAIIKSHALDHRFDIEQRITETGFEIIKERQMEFDIESDPDTMLELFGSEYVSFGEGPVWVYVLERRRAVEVWHSLMGDVDPDIAREETSNSLRALYGITKDKNAVMGSPDTETAEIQIQSIFASSPPFPSSELPDVGSPDPFASFTSGTDDSRQRTLSDKSRSSGSDKAKFRARPVPATHATPDIVPRMSRAASLRAGIIEEKPKRFPATPESLKKTFAGVPGHKRAEVIQVASTAPPVVAPRMTRAAALRLGQPVPAKSERRASMNITASATEVFDGVPGHKRRESIPVASTRPPTVAPRSNRSAELRVLKDAASPPSSFQFRSPGSISRQSSRSSLDMAGSQRPTIIRPASAASLRASNANGVSKTPSRPPSSATNKPLSSSSAANKTNGVPKEETPTKSRPTVASTGAPTISPRTNKSALLRAAKMALSAANGPKTPTKGAKQPVKVQAPKPIRT
ncbi:hypothetical protein BDY19DRAFT_894627 [Irpex rosettiformis]|uniref:Uncharacterized protein n=1 Tax=Irpex rosettiformis TaxID=378272 RepID=A0ACB8TWW1_9APHY|nr:hypothetical protein BDY19DRAFT_894627 [Irpex rosettiformis]